MIRRHGGGVHSPKLPLLKHLTRSFGASQEAAGSPTAWLALAMSRQAKSHQTIRVRPDLHVAAGRESVRLRSMQAGVVFWLFA